MSTTNLRLAVLEGHKITRLSTIVRPHAGAAESKIETRIHQRQCLRCQRWFWAWGRDREKCFVCEPLPPAQLQRVLGEISGARVPSIEPELMGIAG